MSLYQIAITIPDGSKLTLTEIFTDIKRIKPHWNFQQILEVVEQLKDGKEMTYESFELPVLEKLIWSAIEKDDPYEEMKKEEARVYALLDAAVDGDAEAAIEFCRFFRDNPGFFAACG